MVKININAFNDDQFLVNYLNFLTNKVFKILPIFENEPNTLREYLESLLLELAGTKSVVVKLKHDVNFLSLISILQYISQNKCNHKTIKRETFKCIGIINKLKNKYSHMKEE